MVISIGWLTIWAQIMVVEVVALSYKCTVNILDCWKSLAHSLNDHNTLVFYDGKYSSQHYSSWEFVIWKEAECQASM